MIFEHILFFQFDLKTVRRHNMQIFWNNKYLVLIKNHAFGHIFEHISFSLFDLKKPQHANFLE